MTKQDNLQKIRTLWAEIYPEDASKTILNELITELKQTSKDIAFKAQPEGWYKDAIVYSLYVDFFKGTFSGLVPKLPELRELA